MSLQEHKYLKNAHQVALYLNGKKVRKLGSPVQIISTFRKQQGNN